MRFTTYKLPRANLQQLIAKASISAGLSQVCDGITAAWGNWFKQAEETENYVLIYDVLREEPNHPINQLLNRHATFVGSGVFRGRLYDLGRYPGAVRSTNKSRQIVGDVHCCQSGVLKFLDSYEGRRFRRERVDVALGGGRHLLCWIYFYTGNTARRKVISCGSYAEYRAATRSNGNLKAT